MSDDPVASLRDQLDEDERLIRLQAPWPWHLNAEGDEVWAADDELVADAHALSSNQQRNAAAFIVRFDPARMSIDVANKRLLIATYERAVQRGMTDEANVLAVAIGILDRGEWLELRP
jgi:mannose/fructose/N-acetylgalactosamine-specific phosphotransferase system component IIB